jgi:hypothetical protein
LGVLTKKELVEAGSLTPEQSEQIRLAASKKRFRLVNYNLTLLYALFGVGCLFMGFLTASIGGSYIAAEFIGFAIIAFLAAGVQVYTYALAIDAYERKLNIHD